MAVSLARAAVKRGMGRNEWEEEVEEEMRQGKAMEAAIELEEGNEAKERLGEDKEDEAE